MLEIEPSKISSYPGPTLHQDEFHIVDNVLNGWEDLQIQEILVRYSFFFLSE